MRKPKKSPLSGWTDYPMTPEEKGKAAPWRRCRIVAYDQNKYADVEVEGFGLVNIKIGYVLCQPNWEDGGLPVFHRHPFRVRKLPGLSDKARSL